MGVTGYNVYMRRLSDNTEPLLIRTTTETSHEVGRLLPSTWDFEFCVSALNRNVETAPTTCIIPPVCCCFEKRDQVPENYRIPEDMSTVVDDAADWVEDDGIPGLYPVYQQTAEFAKYVDRLHDLRRSEISTVRFHKVDSGTENVDIGKSFEETYQLRESVPLGANLF